MTSGPYSPTISPLEDDEDAVRERQDLLELERDEQDGAALVALLHEPAVHELDRPDVEAPRRLAGDEHPRVALDLAGDHDLLLVSAGEGRGERRRAAAAHVELLQQAARQRDQPARHAASRTSSWARSGSRGAPMFSASVKSRTSPRRWRSSGMWPMPVVEALARRFARDVLAADADRRRSGPSPGR